MRWEPNAASSNTTSYVRPDWTSPIWNSVIGDVPRVVSDDEMSAMRVPSSQTSLMLVAPLTSRWSSSACQPGPMTVELIVVVAAASLRHPS